MSDIISLTMYKRGSHSAFALAEIVVISMQLTANWQPRNRSPTRTTVQEDPAFGAQLFDRSLYPQSGDADFMTVMKSMQS